MFGWKENWVTFGNRKDTHSSLNLITIFKQVNIFKFKQNITQSVKMIVDRSEIKLFFVLMQINTDLFTMDKLLGF